MGVYVSDLLQCKLMKKSRVLSGQTGIIRQINRISVYDCPVRDDIIERNILKEGDLIITSLFFQKSSSILLKDFIDMLNNNGCAGICVSNQFLKQLPQDVLIFANEVEFPIIQFDMNIPYADIIELTMELIIAQQTYVINEFRVERLLKEKMSLVDIKAMAYEINPYFKENLSVIYICDYELKDNNISPKSFLDNINYNSSYKAFYYKSSIIVMLTLAKDDEKLMSNMIKVIFREADKCFKHYNAGISDFHSSLSELNEAINESIFSMKNAKLFDEKICFYDDIGINRILIPIMGHEEMIKFYHIIIDPIEEYDKKYNGEFLKTIEFFVKNDGDYKKTAESLYQHENTIRYRIKKIKMLLKMDDSIIRFYESISIAIKMKNLLKK